jgi:hypothetical protein
MPSVAVLRGNFQYNLQYRIIQHPGTMWGTGHLAVWDSKATLPFLSSVVCKKEHIRVVFDIIPPSPDPRYSSEHV